MLSMPLCEDKPLDVVFGSDSIRKILVGAALRKLRSRRGNTNSLRRQKSGFGQLGRWWGGRVTRPSSSSGVSEAATQDTKTISLSPSPPTPTDAAGGNFDAGNCARPHNSGILPHSEDQGDTRIVDTIGADAAREALLDAGDCLRTLFSRGALALAVGGEDAAVEEDFVYTLTYMPLASSHSNHPRRAGTGTDSCTCCAERDNRLTLVVMRKNDFNVAARSDFYLLNQHNLGGWCCGTVSTSVPPAASTRVVNGNKEIRRDRHVDNAWRAVHALALGDTGGTEVDVVSLLVSPPPRRRAAYSGASERSPRRAGFFTRSRL